MFYITLVAVIPLICILIFKSLYCGGLKLGESSSFARLFVGDAKNDNIRNGVIVPKKKLVMIALEALVFRLVLYFVAYLFLLFIFQSDQNYFDWWTKWDATNYLGIETGGYSEITIDGVFDMGDGVMQTLVFLPLYPFIARLINIVAGNPQLSLLITSTLCYVIGIVYMYKAVAYRYGESVAKKAVILISTSVFAFYQGAMLPESTFLMTIAICIYYTFKRNWYIAGIAGIFCALTRLQGILVIAFMGMEWLEDRQVFALIKNRDKKNIINSLKILPSVFIPLIGLVIYLLVNYLYSGDAFYFLKLQKNIWGHSFTDIFNAMKIMWNQMTESEYVIKLSLYGPQIIIFFLILVLMYFRVKKHSIGLSLYLFFYLMISYSSDYVVSGSRYMSVSIPLFIILAELCEGKEWLYRFLVGFGLSVQIIYMGCHLNGIHLIV